MRLPLSEQQVRGYLGAALPETDPERLLDTLRSVHNLTELSQRPYTLKLVAEFIPEIERDRLAGKPAYGVSLYRRMAQRWLERDGGKHYIRPEHKLRLATHLAVHLWQTGSGRLSAEGIEGWFHAWLASEPDLRRRYAKLHPDQLEEDLRTATFLARQDNPTGSSFRFAHASLLEFFLANYLFQAVRDQAPERWAIKVPSDETLDFLGQLLAQANDPALPHTLQGWRVPYRPQVSELLAADLRPALRRTGRHPAPVGRGKRRVAAYPRPVWAGLHRPRRLGTRSKSFDRCLWGCLALARLGGHRRRWLARGPAPGELRPHAGAALMLQPNSVDMGGKGPESPMESDSIVTGRGAVELIRALYNSGHRFALVDARQQCVGTTAYAVPAGPQ